MSKKNTLVIVESPTKAKTIKAYLGNGYDVIASYGHPRQLLSKPGAIKKNEHYEFTWVSDDKKISYIKGFLSGVSNVLLATDQDREGEAIAWHLRNIIHEFKPNVHTERITFIEITKDAIKKSLLNKRDIDMGCVDSYFGRLASDFFIGFNLTPELWKKTPQFKNLSAGRVQSPALKILCLREFECLAFIPENYYSLVVKLSKDLEVKLFILNDEKLPERFMNREALENINLNKNSNFIVTEINSKKVKVNPYAPLITSTLQQEANSQYGMKVRDVMQIAQQLYEGIQIKGETMGLITYMRTDSTNMSQEAINQSRAYIEKHYPNSLPTTPNSYHKAIKNAQEAHECIRPTNFHLSPEMIHNDLDDRQFKVYSLIWKRALSSQMISATRSQTSIIIDCDKNRYKVTKSFILEKGFLEVYNSQTDAVIEIPVQEGDNLDYLSHEIKEHTTQPPEKYSEASLVSALEKEGIGRPSTYSTIIETLKTRDYVYAQGKHLIPTFKGKFIYLFLETYYSRYVDLEFTAKNEELLDKIANKELNYEQMLDEFYKLLMLDIENNKDITSRDVMGKIGEDIGKKMNKTCPKCNGILKLGYKYSVFFFCEKCEITIKPEEEGIQITEEIKVVIGKTASYISFNNKHIYLPKKCPTNLSQEQIEVIIKLPYEICLYENLPILFGLSKYGFYLKYNDKYVPVSKLEHVFSMTEEKAIGLVSRHMDMINKRLEKIAESTKKEEIKKEEFKNNENNAESKNEVKVKKTDPKVKSTAKIKTTKTISASSMSVSTSISSEVSDKSEEIKVKKTPVKKVEKAKKDK
jgi:DNA topoisomerase-1